MESKRIENMLNMDAIIFIVIFLSLAGAIIGGCIVIMLKTGESKNPLLAELEEEKKSSGNNVAPKDGMGLEAMLDKNNKLLSTWNKTEKAQNQLKMMQASGEAESSS